MRSLKLDKDKRLALPESEVERTCAEWVEQRCPGALYIRTNASDKRRSGAPSHSRYWLDGLLVHPTKETVFIEWKRRFARTQRARKQGQHETADWLNRAGYWTILMSDDLQDPIGYFMERMSGIWNLENRR